MTNQKILVNYMVPGALRSFCRNNESI